MTDLAARPHGRLAGVRDALTPREWARAGAMAATIIGLNVLGWGMLPAAAGGHYYITGTQLFGFGTGVLAYTLGIRHAFDADHIAAIDNTGVDRGAAPSATSATSAPPACPASSATGPPATPAKQRTTPSAAARDTAQPPGTTDPDTPSQPPPQAHRTS